MGGRVWYSGGMKHIIRLSEEGYIETIYDGDVSVEDSKAMFRKRYELAYGLADMGKDVNLLVDTRKLGKVAVEEVNPFVALSLKSLDFNRLAVFGARREVELLAKVLLTLAGKLSRLKIFKTREEAVAWLKRA